MERALTAGQKVAACLLDGTWVSGTYKGVYLNFDRNGSPLVQYKIVRGFRDNVYSIASECMPIEEFKGELCYDPYYEDATQSSIDMDFGVHHLYR